MNRARHFHFTFNVEQTFVAGKSPRSHTHRKPEAIVPQVNLCQPVELPYFFARKCNQPLAIGDGLLQLLLGVVMPHGLGAQCGLDIQCLYQGCPATAAQGGTFQNQCLGLRENRALAGLIVCLPVGVFQQPCHASG